MMNASMKNHSLVSNVGLFGVPFSKKQPNLHERINWVAFSSVLCFAVHISADCFCTHFRAEQWLFKLKSLVFTAMTKAFTHRIRHWCFLNTTFPIMNFDTAWFIRPLGRLISHHKRTASEFVFNRAETNLLRETWIDCFGADIPEHDIPKRT